MSYHDECSAASADLAAVREFDYGVTDERYEATRRARREIAAAIRRAAAAEVEPSTAVRWAYETAARLAEGAEGASADEQRPRWS